MGKIKVEESVEAVHTHTHTHTGNLKNKEQRGITLVALVITIIILLILAAITIGQLTKSGLFNKAKDSKDENIRAMAEEEISLIVMSVQAEKHGEATIRDVIEYLEKDKENSYIVRTEKKTATLVQDEDRKWNQNRKYWNNRFRKTNLYNKYKIWM